jgi:hypothetical protein
MIQVKSLGTKTDFVQQYIRELRNFGLPLLDHSCHIFSKLIGWNSGKFDSETT